MPRIILDSCRNPLFGLIYEASLLSKIEEGCTKRDKEKRIRGKNKTIVRCNQTKVIAVYLFIIITISRILNRKKQGLIYTMINKKRQLHKAPLLV